MLLRDLYVADLWGLIVINIMKIAWNSLTVHLRIIIRKFLIIIVHFVAMEPLKQ